MNIKALRQLERVVTDAPDELFNMHVIERKLNCGTVRCAFGWTLVDPWFQENTDAEGAFARIKSGKVAFNSELGSLFGISPRDANNLFGGDLSGFATTALHHQSRRDVTKLEVIANIRRLLRGEPTKPYKATSP